MDIGTLTLLFFVALCAGAVDAIAGGGGLITLPALLFAGVSPAQALATNKIQALASVASSAYRFSRSGVVDIQRLRKTAVASAIGAGLGALTVRLTDVGVLAKVAPLILICVALFFLFSRNVLLQEKSRRLIGDGSFVLIAAFPIGFYDGFFGPGTGSIYAAAFVVLLGSDLTTATANTKILNAVGSAIAAVVFLPGSIISWPAALAMSAGGIIGAQFGVRTALAWGAPLIRAVLVIISVALAARLLAQQLHLWT